MSNSYTHFCFEITELTASEKEWWEEKLQAINTIREMEKPEDDLSDEEELELLKMFSQQGDFDWGIDTDVEKDSITFSDDGGAGNADSLLELLSVFLKKFRPKEMIAFEMAHTCDKQRPGEFGGTVLWATADGQYAAGTGGLMEKLHAAIKRGQRPTGVTLVLKKKAKRKRK